MFPLSKPAHDAREEFYKRERLLHLQIKRAGETGAAFFFIALLSRNRV